MSDQNDLLSQPYPQVSRKSTGNSQGEAELLSISWGTIQALSTYQIPGWAIELTHLFAATSEKLKWIEVVDATGTWRAPVSHFYKLGIRLDCDVPMVFLPYRHWTYLRTG
jgi:hypothetical protein